MQVLIAGGGTGGHLFPGVAVAQELRRRHPDARIVFVGTARGIEARAVPKAGFELELLPVSGLRRAGFKGLVLGLARLPLALLGAIKLVRRLRPDVAVSVGGYAAGPAVLAARLCGVPCVVMEQNAVAGVTNRILGKLARKVIAALPSRDFPADKTAVLGNPVRADLLPVREHAYAPATPLRLLVLGGSQGARALNETMMALAPKLVESGLPLSIVHQTGTADAARVQAAYEAANVRGAIATAFIDDMAAAYRDADLLLCRAGASTLAELTVCGRPAILVPFPFAADDHQSANARTLAASGAALHIPQDTLTADGLLALLRELAGDPARLSKMAACSRAEGKPDAVRAIADTLEQEAARV
jgi:UDP-N-acetylglucosamine--N-acetylmuramyl-(pentapeptide) pyrophosphoryl-undecaprenol N-acetylglucosamine transferase